MENFRNEVLKINKTKKKIPKYLINYSTHNFHILILCISTKLWNFNLYMDNIKLLSCATVLFNCIIERLIYAVPHHFDGFSLTTTWTMPTSRHVQIFKKLSESSCKSGLACSIHICTNAFGKGMTYSLLLPAKGLILQYTKLTLFVGDQSKWILPNSGDNRLLKTLGYFHLIKKNWIWGKTWKKMS